jgi:multisubunit Na+/H+ antiporter MnhB subunit
VNRAGEAVSLLAITAALTTAAVLLRAVVGKIRHPGDVASTMTRLGVPRETATPAAMVLIAAEFATAAALLFRPDSALTQIAVIVLAIVFALAGLRAMRLDERVACNCFGTGGQHLGLRQVVMLIPWTMTVAILHYGASPLPVETGAAAFAVTAAAVAALEVIGVIRAVQEARGDRRSAEEMYGWLPSY